MGECGGLIHIEFPCEGLSNLRYAYDDIEFMKCTSIFFICIYLCLDNGRILLLYSICTRCGG